MRSAEHRGVRVAVPGGGAALPAGGSGSPRSRAELGGGGGGVCVGGELGNPLRPRGAEIPWERRARTHGIPHCILHRCSPGVRFCAARGIAACWRRGGAPAASPQEGVLLNCRSIQIKMVSVENSLIKPKGNKAALRRLLLQDGAGSAGCNLGSAGVGGRAACMWCPPSTAERKRSSVWLLVNAVEVANGNPFPAPQTSQRDYCHSGVWERRWRLPSMLPGLGGGCKWRMSQELCMFSAR